MFSSIEVSSRGLSAARLRVNVLASNIANAETTRTEDGGPYKRKDIVQIARTVNTGFSSALDRMSLASPMVQSVVEDNSPGKQIYKPGHPDANPQGFVEMPNINVVTSMTDLMSASRLYQANISALETARQMGRDAARISIRF